MLKIGSSFALLAGLVSTLSLTAYSQPNRVNFPSDPRNNCDNFYDNIRRFVVPAPARPPKQSSPNLLGAINYSYPEFSEGNALEWGTFASDGRACSVADDTSKVKVGSQSIKFTTQSGFDTGVKYPALGNAEWNLTNKTHLSFWAYADNNTSGGFQGNQPIVVLNCAGGSYRYTPSSQIMTNKAWGYYSIPLAGDSQWIRTTTGTPSLTHVLQLEIHHDTWDYGFTVYYDGVRFMGPADDTTGWPTPPPPPGVDADVIKPRVLLYCFDPIMENKGGKRQHAAYSFFQDPVQLTSQIVDTMRIASHGKLQYQVVETKVVDAHPYYVDGFQHTDASFDQAWAARDFHNSTFDYARFVAENGIQARIDSGDLDEVWIYAGPINGMWESTMAGRGAYWVNGPTQNNITNNRAFVMMGWNFERGVGEAIHSYGHRAESVMTHSYGLWADNQSTSWNKFSLLDMEVAGLGGIGNVHFPVNGLSDYDYNNSRIVPSNSDDWATYPNFAGLTRSFNSHEWSPTGIDPQREYLSWWYNHMPYFKGMGTDGFLNNWWRYIADVDQFKGWSGNVLGTANGPVAVITNPLNNARVSGVVNIDVDAGAEGAMGRVDLYVDGVYHSSDTMAPYTFQWDSSLSVGVHRLEAKAYELRYGREAVSTPVFVNTNSLIKFEKTSYEVNEQNGGVGGVATINVLRSGNNTLPLTVNYATSDGTAIAGSDYQAANGTLIFGAGESSKSFTVNIENDALDEEDETINLALSSPGLGGTLDMPSTATLTIHDDDPAPDLSIDDTTTDEGNSGSADATFTVTLSGPSSHSITVDYATADGTATAGSDYTAVSGTLTFDPGQTQKTITVPVLGDTVYELNERYSLNLSNPQQTTISDDQGIGIIRNDESVGAHGGIIAFTSNRDGNNEIYVMNADGSNQTRLTNDPANDETPAFSPDGSKIVFASQRNGDYEIYVMNADGSNQTRLTNNSVADQFPAFSPNGSKIVFSSKRDGGANEIYTMNSSGANPVRLTSNSADDIMPQFSPDGSKIVFVSDRVGSQFQGYIMDTDGSNPILLFENLPGNYGVQYNPYGDQLLFHTFIGPNQDPEICTIDADGKNQTRLTQTAGIDSNGWWSPDGQQIVFESERNGNSDIWIMNNDGSQPVQLTTNPATDSDPTWTFGQIVPQLSIDDVNVTETDSGTSSATFTVSLAQATSSSVSVNYATADGSATEGSDYTAVSGTLTFNPGETSKTVTVPIIGDAIFEPQETFKLNLSNSTNGTIEDAQGVGTIVDNDVIGVAVTPVSGLITTEAGGEVTFTVKLASRPTDNVSLDLSSSKPQEGTVAPTSLIFTPANWDSEQTVTITGVNDFVADGDVAYTIQTAAPSSSDVHYAALSAGDIPDVAVTNTDDDTAGIVLTHTTNLTTGENGTSTTFSITLNSQPVAPVTIGLSSSNPQEGSVAPTSVTFTAQNWSQAQPVTITGVDDQVADGAQSYTIITAPASSTDPNYQGRNVDDVAVQNTDDDTAHLLLTISPSTVAEGGQVSGRITRNTLGNLQVQLASSDTSEATVPASVLIPAGQDSITFPIEVIDDDTADGTQTVTITASAQSLQTTANLDIQDNDTAGISISPTAGLTTTEAGGATQFSVVLNSRPTGEVTIALASSKPEEGAITPTSLAFTPTNWDSGQTVTVTGVNDFVADGDVAYTIQTAAPNSSDVHYAALSAGDIPDVAVTNTDDDTAGIIVSNATGLTTGEDGTVATFSIILNSQPVAPVTIGLSSSNPQEGSVAPTSAIFTAQNWNQTHLITITGVDDQVADGPQSYTIVTAPATSTDPNYQGRNIDDVTVQNTDNDTTNLLLTISPSTVTEGGQVSGRITRNTLGELQVQLSSSDTSEATVPASVLIPAGQDSITFPIEVIDDDTADGTQTVTITASAQSLQTTANLDIQDNDTAGISISPTAGLTTTEAGGATQFSVVLNSRPTGEVTIALASSRPEEGVPNPAWLVFTPANWNTRQTVAITGVDDTLVDDQQSYAIVTSPTVSADPAYNGFNATDIEVINKDDDTPALSLTFASSTIREDGGANATTGILKRNFLLHQSITASLRSSEADVIVPESVSFPAGASEVKFAIRIANNNMAEGRRSAVITATSGRASSSQTLIVADDDSPVLHLSLTSTSIAENSTSTVRATVTRNTPPVAAMAIALSSSDPSEARVPAKINILAGETSTTFDITAIDDHWADGPQRLTINARAAGFPVTTAPLTVTDDEKASLTLTINRGRLVENGTATATLRRNNEITANTTSLPVNVTADIAGQLTFPRTVTIPARVASTTFSLQAVDNRLSDGPRTVTLTAKAAGFASGISDITITDNEAASHGIIDGKVTLPANLRALPVPGVTLVLRQGNRVKDRVVSASNGVYRLSGLAAGTYTITPTKPNYAFTPAVRAIVLSHSTMTVHDINFNGTPRAQLSGLLTGGDQNGNSMPLSNVTIVARGTAGSFQVRTNRLGGYLFDRLPVGTYVIAPQQTGTTFTPHSHQVNLTPASPVVANLDFQIAGTNRTTPLDVTVLQPGAANYTPTTQNTLTAVGTARDQRNGSGLAAITVAIGRFASTTSTTPTGFWNWNSHSFVPNESTLLVEALATGTTVWRLDDPTALAGLRALPPGSYGIRATAVDNGGNQKRSLWKRFNIASSDPARDQEGTNSPVETSPETPSVGLVPEPTSERPSSTVRLSSAAAYVAGQKLVLLFTGKLDEETATHVANYQVELGGQRIAIEMLSYSNGTVTLGLAENALSRAETVKLTYRGLRDSHGKLLATNAVTMTAR